MTFHLTDVMSFTADQKGFCLPVFGSNISNRSFVQNLDANGFVQQLVPFNATALHRVNEHPPPLQVDVGSKGWLAFIDDDDRLHVGTQEELVLILPDLPISSPFDDLSIAAMLDDRGRQASAVSECMYRLRNLDHVDAWARREKSCFRIAENLLSSSSNGKYNEKDGELRKELSALERSLIAKDWEKKWIQVWEKNFERKRLVALACIRFDQGIGFDDGGPEIFLKCFRYQFDHSMAVRCTEVIERISYRAPYWVQLFNMCASSRPKLMHESIEIAFSWLRSGLSATSKADYRWISLWEALFRRTMNREIMRDFAVQYLDKRNVINNDVASSLIAPFVAIRGEFEPLSAAAYNWVTREPRSTVVWAKLYLALREVRPDAELQNLGLYWLENLGGNLSSWRDVWLSHKGELKPAVFLQLGINWLARCRWDMGAWVKVFFDLLPEVSDHERPLLRKLGREWMSAGYGTRSGRKRVGEAVSYLEAICGEN